MHNKHAVICACIIGAYREIGTEELSRLFQRRQLLGIKGTNGDQEVCETDGRVELARVGGFTQEPRDSRAGSLQYLYFVRVEATLNELELVVLRGCLLACCFGAVGVDSFDLT